MRAELAGWPLQEPWCLVEDPGIVDAELQREMPPGHRLYGRRCTAIARRDDCDDVLYWVDDPTAPVACVHLTFSKETDPFWPATTVYGSLDDWKAKDYLPSVEEWHS